MGSKQHNVWMRVIIPYADLSAQLALFKSSRDPLFVLFTADKPDSKERWCPDCRSADPIINEALESAPASATLLEVILPRSEWKATSPPHPLRALKPFVVTRIPTLVQLENNAVTRRFVEGECEQLEALQAMFLAANKL